MARRALFKKKSFTSPAGPSTSDHLVPVASAPRPKQSYGGTIQGLSILDGLLYAPSGIYTQVHDSQGPHVEKAQTSVDSDPFINSYAAKAPVPVNKKERQSEKWAELIPILIGPYMSLFKKTISLSQLDLVRSSPLCQGCDKGHNLKVTCVFLDRMSHLFSILTIQ
jgi:hypothetical protein